MTTDDAIFVLKKMISKTDKRSKRTFEIVCGCSCIMLSFLFNLQLKFQLKNKHWVVRYFISGVIDQNGDTVQTLTNSRFYIQRRGFLSSYNCTKWTVSLVLQLHKVNVFLVLQLYNEGFSRIATAQRECFSRLAAAKSEVVSCFTTTRGKLPL